MNDIYYSPDQYGLETIADIEWDDEMWQFNISVVWKKIGTKTIYYWGSDSGCSCPGIFEGQTIDDLTKGTKAQAIAYLQEQSNGRMPDRLFNAIVAIRKS